MRKILPYIAVILWMALIFKLSSQPAVESSKLSTGIAKTDIKYMEKVKPNTKANLAQIDHMVRKNAHFLIYLVLGVLIMNALRSKSIALLICILYAILDEFHQVFVPGRGPAVRDVFIDSTGALVGILVCLGIKKKISPSKYFKSVKD